MVEDNTLDNTLSARDLMKLRAETVTEVDAVTASTYGEFYQEGEEKESPPKNNPTTLDSFALLFQRLPSLKEDPPDQVRAAAVDQIKTTQMYEEIHRNTLLDYELSAALTPTIYAELVRVEEREREIRQKEVTLTEEEENCRNGAHNHPAGQCASEIKQKRKELNKARSESRAQTIKTLSKVKDAVEASKTLENLGWGNERGQFAALCIDNHKIAQTIPIIKKVRDWFGRLQQLKSITQARIPMKTPEYAGVAVGDDLKRVLPQELALFDEEPDLFYYKYFQKSLLLYDLEQAHQLNEEAARGDMVVLIDESGSMSGDPVAYAKAFAFVLREEAKKDQRRAHLVSFAHDEKDLCELRPEATQREAAEWLQRFINGGTDFVPPLNKAFQIIKEERLRNPDVVFLTDGCCELPNEEEKKLATLKQQTGARIFWFRFGSGSGLEPLADKTYDVSLEHNQLQIEEFFFDLEAER